MHESYPQNDPIVITGAGLVCALGLDTSSTWDAVVRGECGIRTLTRIEQAERCCKGGGQAPELPEHLHRDEPREVRYLRVALQEALEEAAFLRQPPPPHRCGIILGTTLAGMRAAGDYLRDGNLQHLARFTPGSTMQRAIEGLPIAGFATTTCAACASGLSSVALAMTMLRSNELDLVVAGGYDPISEYAYAGFDSLRLVADGPLTPFLKDRGGMKLGEGYGIIVVERAADARARSAAVLAHVRGFGESSDAHHLTQPHPQGDGAARAIRAALADAGLTSRDISMIAAHATATPNNDAAEYQAYKQVFGDGLAQVPVVAFKSHLGHTLGGAGTVELILSMLALRHQCVPPTANVDPAAIEFEDLRVLIAAQRQAVRNTINVSMGFGGANACIALGSAESIGQPKATRAPRAAPHRRCAASITGIGVIAPDCIGNSAFMERLQGRGAPGEAQVGGIDDGRISELVNARRVRRMSEYVKLLLAATTLAMRDAGASHDDDFAAECGIILGSTHGAIGFSETYYRQVVEEGVSAANPMLFAEGVPNVGSAQLSLMLGVRCGSQTIVGSRTAGLDTLRLASLRIQTGVWERAIIGAAEEFHPLVNQAYERCGAGPIAASSGAVVMIVESREAAEARGARVYGTVGRGESARTTNASADGLASVIKSVCGRLGPGVRALTSDGQPLPGEMFSVTPLASIAAALLTPCPGTCEPVQVVWHDPCGQVCGLSVTADPQVA